VFRCSYLRPGLYVSVLELQNSVVCCHNLPDLELSEAQEAMKSLLAWVLWHGGTAAAENTRVVAVCSQALRYPSTTHGLAMGFKSSMHVNPAS
jgi:hypothetical protein